MTKEKHSEKRCMGRQSHMLFKDIQKHYVWYDICKSNAHPLTPGVH